MVTLWVAETPFCVAVAVIVTVDVPLGVPGMVCLDPLPPQAVTPNMRANRSMGNNLRNRLPKLLFLVPIRQSEKQPSRRQAYVTPLALPDRAVVLAVVLTVTVAVAAPAPIAIAGALQLARPGKPEQANVTVPVKPASGVTVNE